MRIAIWLTGGIALLSGAWGTLLGLRHRWNALFIACLSVAGCACFVLLVLMMGQSLRARYADFLDECTQYRPKYECILLWRASDRSEGSKDPMIIPMPSGR